MTSADTLQPGLASLRSQHLYRRRRVAEPTTGACVRVDGEELLGFCSNDYLGLSRHPEIVEAMVAAARRDGVGSGASHLVSGHCREHHALEEELADFVGRERALLFSTGYMANLGVIAAVAGRSGAIVSDELNHASLIDGARLSGARVLRYGHADVAAAAAAVAGAAAGGTTAAAAEADVGDAAGHRGKTSTVPLQATAGRDPAKSAASAAGSGGRVAVVTDGVFSMDGDLAPLPALARMAAANKAWLIVDDAHGLGVTGATGRGTLEHFKLGVAEVPVLVGTLGKAFGVFGAFVAGDTALCEWLIQKARTYIYTTALPPPVAAAARAALAVAQRDSWRRDRLRAHIDNFRRAAQSLGLPLMDSATPIQPLMLGSAERALAASRALGELGLWITAIRPPTVPKDSARLRITFSAAHEAGDIDRLCDALSRLKKLGLV
jgi:8-amino-7-oxononanoate synthase